MSVWKELTSLGMEVWYDDLSRDLITTGKLRKMIREDGLSGITSNPTIFENAFKSNPVYIEDIKKLCLTYREPEKIYDELLIHDIRMAAQAFESLFDSSRGELGFVSLELSPLYAHDTEKTVSEVKRLISEVGLENIMVKVPATDEGIPAITQLISEGYNINVTLIFSVKQYEKVALAYIEGLKRRYDAKLPLNNIRSVASVFMSRLDTYVDALLERMAERDDISEEKKKKALGLRGKASIAVGRLVYKKFLEIFDSEDFRILENSGARIQNPLWASTGTKNPSYSDIKYVQELIYPDTIVTVPSQTFEAFNYHGKPVIAEMDFDEQLNIERELNELGIDLEDVGKYLLKDGEERFVNSYLNILKTIADYV
ncbi:MAG: transaldolase [Actinobacteria bacterium]|nr:transaldolase [Actinomycetota bacterium]